MLKKISIKNIKSHRDTKIEFSEFVTAITGQSSHGKSVIVESIVLAAQNNRPAKGLITKNIKTNQGSVCLEFDDCSVELQKNKGRESDKYILQDSHEKLELGSFSRNVPEEVKNAIKLTDMNFHIQHSSPFLIYGGKPAYSKEINKIIGLDNIVERFKIISSKSMRLKSEFKSKMEEQRKVEDFLDSMTEYVEIVECEENMSSLNSKIRGNAERLEYLENYNIPLSSEELSLLEKTSSKLKGVLRRWGKISENKLELIEKIKLLKSFKEEPVINTVKISKSISEIESLTNKINGLDSLLKNLMKIKKLKLSLKSQKEKMDKYIGKKCDACGQEIKI